MIPQKYEIKNFTLNLTIRCGFGIFEAPRIQPKHQPKVSTHRACGDTH
jgi:hypothetical protein